MAGVKSIDRAFAILGALAGGPAGVTAIAVAVGLPKSSTARLLGSLLEQGAVEQLEDGRYQIGRRLVVIAAGANPVHGLAALAVPYLASLAAATGEGAMIGVPDGRRVLYLGQVAGSHEVTARDWTGVRIPLHQTSGGLIVLAASTEAELAAYLSVRLEASSLATVTDPIALRRRLASIAELGYAWVQGEYAEGLSSVASGVADETGRIVCVLAVHGPSFRFPPPGRKQAIGRLVADTAGRMAAELRAGGTPAARRRGSRRRPRPEASEPAD